MCMSIRRIQDCRIDTFLDTLPAIPSIASPNRHCSQLSPLLKFPQLMMLMMMTNVARHPNRDPTRPLPRKEWPTIVHARRYPATISFSNPPQPLARDGTGRKWYSRLLDFRHAAHWQGRHKCVHRLGRRHRPSVCESRACRCRGGVVVM